MLRPSNIGKVSLVCFPVWTRKVSFVFLVQAICGWLLIMRKQTRIFFVHTRDHLSKAPRVEKLKSSEMVSLKANHIEHLVRCNSKFLQFADLDYEGKPPEEYYRRLLWLYAYVEGFRFVWKWVSRMTAIGSFKAGFITASQFVKN